MKVKIRDDESRDDTATWTVYFPVCPVSRRRRDEERADDGRAQDENGGEERER